MLEKLISFPTVSRESNLDLINFVKEYLSSFGVTPHLVFNEKGNKANLYANVGPMKPDGIILSGHTDVVPVDGQNWLSDPFKLREAQGKLFGRGTCDMKSFNAIFLSLLPEMLNANLQRPIQFALSYDEEVGCIGAPDMIKKIKKTLPKARSVVVGEPTMMKIINGHKASIGIETHVKGFEVHSSIMHTGVSAVMTAAKLIKWISDRTEENQLIEPNNEDRDFEPPFTTLHVGTISGGTASNITAKDCTFMMDIRCLPSDDGEEWIKKYQVFAKSLASEMKKVQPSSGIKIESHHWVPGLKPEVAGTAESLIKKLTGQNSTGKVSYGTEAGQFQNEGYSTIICGPGSIKQAHKANEFLDKSQLIIGEEFIKKLIFDLTK